MMATWDPVVANWSQARHCCNLLACVGAPPALFPSMLSAAFDNIEPDVVFLFFRFARCFVVAWLALTFATLSWLRLAPLKSDPGGQLALAACLEGLRCEICVTSSELGGGGAGSSWGRGGGNGGDSADCWHRPGKCASMRASVTKNWFFRTSINSLPGRWLCRNFRAFSNLCCLFLEDFLVWPILVPRSSHTISGSSSGSWSSKDNKQS